MEATKGMIKQHMMEVDGATLQVFVIGDSGPLICTTHPWGTYTGQLSEHDPPFPTRLVQVNPRGSGQSSPGRSAEDYTFKQLVDDLEAVRRQLSSEPWIFMGYSGGGYAGLHYALQYPEYLRGMIIGWCTADREWLLDDPRSVLSPAHPTYQEMFVNKPQLPETAQREPFTGWAAVGKLWIWYGHDQPVLVFQDEPDERVRSYMSDLLVHNLGNHLGDITVPTLTFSGRNDPMIPWQHVGDLQRIPDSEFVLLECGHVDMSNGNGLEDYQAAVYRFFTDRLQVG
jgi:pimeloyl-ACP methyl ester carboxylesterase